MKMNFSEFILQYDKTQILGKIFETNQKGIAHHERSV